MSSLSTLHTVCHLLSLGIASIIGPQSSSTSHHVGSICDNFEIPHLSVGWGAGRGAGYSLSLAPSPQQLGRGQ